jgi:FkbM family methyltransferase
MMEYDLEYGDLLTFCPQWQDIFVERSLAFESTVQNPRILDCGANVGLSTLFYTREYPQARITAYEADPDVAAQLARNLRVNRAAHVDVVSSAVWIDNGVVSFAAQGADAGSLERFAQHAHRRSIQVASIRLADIIAREAVDLLKLDVEGAELDIVRDIAPYLQHVRAMQIEVHEFQPDCRRLPDVLTILRSGGFRYSISRVTHLPWLDRPTWRQPFPGVPQSWVAAVCAWRPDAQ